MIRMPTWIPRPTPLPLWTTTLFTILLYGCSDEPVQDRDKEIVRGLKTFVVSDQQDSTVREYPSVLQPSSLTVLSFEVAGKLKPLSLSVGQSVAAGSILAELEPASLQLQVETAQATLDQATANAAVASTDFQRKAKLNKDGFVSAAELDQARSTMDSSQAQVRQATKQLETAEENATKSVLIAPFEGIVNAIEVDSYATVGSGSPVVSMYSSSAFEASFSVSFKVAEMLTVGKKAIVTLADRPEIQLQAVISELGSRADTVSSFPVVISLTETHATLKAGMAIGVSLAFEVPKGNGFPLPLQAFTFKSMPDKPVDPATPADSSVFIYDPDTSTVQERAVQIAGVQENSVIVVSGLEAGERVASAGVSFLKNGQKVKLLDMAK